MPVCASRSDLLLALQQDVVASTALAQLAVCLHSKHLTTVFAIPVQVQQLLLRVHWQGDCLLADLHSLSASEARAAVLCMLASMQVRLAGGLVYVRPL